jgi:hypothetical protein
MSSPDLKSSWAKLFQEAAYGHLSEEPPITPSEPPEDGQLDSTSPPRTSGRVLGVISVPPSTSEPTEADED